MKGKPMREKIQKVLHLTGLDDMIAYTANDVFERTNALLDDMKAGNATIPPEQAADMIAKFGDATVSEKSTLEAALVDKAVAICTEKGYTESDLDEVITFLESPLSGRVREIGSAFMDASGPIRNEWANELLKKYLSPDLMAALGYNVAPLEDLVGKQPAEVTPETPAAPTETTPAL
jgi:hypothetical protein